MGGFDEVRADLKWAVRSLRKRPGFTAIAALTLALGIGANSAIFTLVDAHFFEALPYDAPDELVLVWETGRNGGDLTTVAPGNYWSWRDEAESFVDIAAYNVDFGTLTGDGAAERVTASVVTPHFFDVLGAAPMLGSGFDEASVRESGAAQVVLSHSLWTRRYGADPGVLGLDIQVDGRPHTVVGVMSEAFRQPERSLSWQTTELWRPMLLEESRDDRGSRYLRTVARRRADVSIEQARGEMEGIAARLAASFPEANAGRSVLVYSVDEYLMGDSRPTLLLLLVAGVAVLIIVCANVANLTLARGEERMREFAVRSALGSGGGRLVRQIVVEGVVLGTLGALIGTAVVIAASDVLQAVQTRFFSGLIDVRVDVTVIGATALAGVCAGALFGLPLARAASRPDLRTTLVAGGERGNAGTSDVTRSGLVVGQIALSTTLLVVAALLARSFTEMVSVPPGFDADGVVTFTVSPPTAGYEERDDLVRYHEELLARVEAIPGVAQVATVSDLMFTTENMFTTFVLPDRVADPANPPRAEYHVTVPSYFDVLDIPVLEGVLPLADAEGAEIPLVINQRMAEVFWPEGGALGAVAELEWAEPSQMRVVAIVADVLDDGYVSSAEPIFYLPFNLLPRRRMSYLVQAAGEPSELFAGIRAAVSTLDPDVPVGNLTLLDGMLAESVARPRAASLIGFTFAIIALLVSAAGIYGIISYSVQQRTRELGIRAALGADGSDLVSMVMRGSTRLVVLGLGLGAAGAVFAARRLGSMLFGVRAWDPTSLLGAVVILGVVASLAAWVPARRAVRVNPRDALRAE